MKKIDFEQAVGKTIKKMGVLDDDTLVILFEKEFMTIQAETYFERSQIETNTEFSTKYFQFEDVAELFGHDQAKVFHAEWVARDEEYDRQFKERRKAEKLQQYNLLKKEFEEG